MKKTKNQAILSKVYKTSSLALLSAMVFSATACGSTPALKTTNLDGLVGKAANQNTESDFDLLSTGITVGDIITFKGDEPYKFSEKAAKVTVTVNDRNFSFTLEDGWKYEVVNGTNGDFVEGIKFYKNDSEKDSRFMLFMVNNETIGVCGLGLNQRNAKSDEGEMLLIGYFDSYTEWAFIDYREHDELSIKNCGLINDDAVTAMGIAKSINIL